MNEKYDELVFDRCMLDQNKYTAKILKDFLSKIPDTAVIDIFSNEDRDAFIVDAVWLESEEKTQELPKDLSAVAPKYTPPTHFRVERPTGNPCTRDCKYNGFKTHIPGCGIYAKD